MGPERTRLTTTATAVNNDIPSARTGKARVREPSPSSSSSSFAWEDAQSIGDSDTVKTKSRKEERNLRRAVERTLKQSTQDERSPSSEAFSNTDKKKQESKEAGEQDTFQREAPVKEQGEEEAPSSSISIPTRGQEQEDAEEGIDASGTITPRKRRCPQNEEAPIAPTPPDRLPTPRPPPRSCPLQSSLPLPRQIPHHLCHWLTCRLFRHLTRWIVLLARWRRGTSWAWPRWTSSTRASTSPSTSVADERAPLLPFVRPRVPDTPEEEEGVWSARGPDLRTSEGKAQDEEQMIGSSVPLKVDRTQNPMATHIVLGLRAVTVFFERTLTPRHAAMMRLRAESHIATTTTTRTTTSTSLSTHLETILEEETEASCTPLGTMAVSVTCPEDVCAETTRSTIKVAQEGIATSLATDGFLALDLDRLTREVASLEKVEEDQVKQGLKEETLLNMRCLDEKKKEEEEQEEEEAPLSPDGSTLATSETSLTSNEYSNPNSRRNKRIRNTKKKGKHRH
ncbi:MAG: hypothetical protein BYD32DRAFT_408307 [Podila humilis]|nr:MAG: hypothetical protein BYD32DRAFT_408307 [Podila humilis]